METLLIIVYHVMIIILEFLILLIILALVTLDIEMLWIYQNVSLAFRTGKFIIYLFN